MRTAPTSATTMLLLLVLLAATLAAPAAALAVDGLPEEMVDPAVAMEPELDADPAPAPTAPAPAAPAAPAADPADEVVTVQGVDAVPSAPVDTVRAPAATAPIGGGTLPFTGPDSDLLMLLFLVGSLSLAGGAVAFAHARALAETA